MAKAVFRGGPRDGEIVDLPREIIDRGEFIAAVLIRPPAARADLPMYPYEAINYAERRCVIVRRIWETGQGVLTPPLDGINYYIEWNTSNAEGV